VKSAKTLVFLKKFRYTIKYLLLQEDAVNVAG